MSSHYSVRVLTTILLLFWNVLAKGIFLDRSLFVLLASHLRTLIGSCFKVSVNQLYTIYLFSLFCLFGDFAWEIFFSCLCILIRLRSSTFFLIIFVFSTIFLRDGFS